MADLKAVESRLDSAATLKNVVHAMRSQAAVYYRSAEEALVPIRAWGKRVRQALASAARRLDAIPQASSRGGREGVVVLSSDQGLCGAFNDRILDFVLSKKAVENTDEAIFVAVGRRGADLMRLRSVEPVQEEAAPTSLEGIHRAVQELALEVLSIFESRHLSRLRLCHNRHRGPGRFEPVAETVLPLDLEGLIEGEEEPFPGRVAAVNLDPVRLVERLTREHFFILLYGAAVESYASENGARLAAMEAAMSNIEEKVAELQGLRNTLRQEAITGEVIEIASGAAAVS